MKEKIKSKREAGKEAVTWLLGWLEDETREAEELFDQWARRRKYRYEGEHKLAEQLDQERRAFKKRVAYLKRKELIKTKKTEKGLLLELSDFGRTELIKREVQNRAKLPNGEVCLVVYDIPTTGKKGRDAFRYFLKKIGFKQVQQSVWSIDRDVDDVVKEFVQRAKIQKWVEIYRSWKR